MANSADPDQLASEEAKWSGSILFAKAEVYPGSAGQGLKGLLISTHNVSISEDFFFHRLFFNIAQKILFMRYMFFH